MESKVVPDENIIASSWVGHQAPYFARLNLQFRGWVPVASDLQRWLQIELNKEETLTHVATQGNTPDINYQYCKSYMLRYRKSDGTFIVYEENGKARVRVVIFVDTTDLSGPVAI